MQVLCICNMRSTTGSSRKWGYIACLRRLSPPLMFENRRMPNGTSKPSLGLCGVGGRVCEGSLYPINKISYGTCLKRCEANKILNTDLPGGGRVRCLCFTSIGDLRDLAALSVKVLSNLHTNPNFIDQTRFVYTYRFSNSGYLRSHIH